MFNLYAITNESNKDDSKKWPYRMLIVGLSGSGKTNALLNLVQQDNDNFIDKIYLYAKDLHEPKYQFLIKKRGDAVIKNLNDPSAFIQYSNTIGDFYNNIDDCYTKRKRKLLIVFNHVISDIMTNEKFQAIIKELLITQRKLSISYIFVIQSYFSVPKEVTEIVQMNLTLFILLILHYLLTVL